MDNYSKIYWLTRLDYLQGLFIFIIVVSIIGLVLFYIGRGTTGEWEFNEDKKQKLKDNFLKNFKWIPKVSYTLLICASLFVTFLPSKNDMILIYAGGKTMDYVQKDTSLQKIPYQTTSIISEYLGKSIKELKDKK